MLGVIVAAALVQTTIPLAALGYPNGIPLTGGAVTLRLPVHPGLQRVGLRFPIEAFGALAHAQVRVSIEGREVAVRSGEELRNVTLQADVPVHPGAHPIDITLLSRAPQCGKEAATYLARVKSTGAVIVTQDALAAQQVRASYAGAFTIIEPAHPDASWQARALAAGYTLHVLDDWRSVTVALGATPAPGTVGVSDLGAIALPSPSPSNGERTFADLGVRPLVQSGENVEFVVPFVLGQLDGVPDRLIARLQVRASAPARIEALLNGREINAFSVEAGMSALGLPMSVSLLRGTNALRIVVRFDHPQTFCETAAPTVALNGSSLRWSGRGDIPMTIERGLGQLSGRIIVESDPSIFTDAFAVISALGSVNRSIDAIDARPLNAGTSQRAEIEIGPASDIEPVTGGSYAEVRVEPNGAIRVSYIGDPSVLQRLPKFRGLLADSDATNFEFGTSGAILTRGGPFSTAAEQRQRNRRMLFAAFLIVLAISTYLIARRARRFS
jgi:hypothetical protein